MSIWSKIKVMVGVENYPTLSEASNLYREWCGPAIQRQFEAETVAELELLIEDFEIERKIKERLMGMFLVETNKKRRDTIADAIRTPLF